MDALAPPAGTVERWAWDYLASASLAGKLAPPPPPRLWEEAPPGRRVERPGRPPELTLIQRAPKTPRGEALRDPTKRAEMLHTFLHHELQAAELMCWAILAFPEAPQPLRRGLLGVCADEIRHMAMYGEHMERLGLRFGERPVNDWFWSRVPQVTTVTGFLATMGMGFEAGNLDHAARFAVRFREAGDVVGAELQDRVAAEEIPHVKLGTTWFRTLTGASTLDFQAWRGALPVPLTPTVMHGSPMNLHARRAAGFDDAFLGELTAW